MSWLCGRGALWMFVHVRPPSVERYRKEFLP
jgi:hypothetical protein